MSTIKKVYKGKIFEKKGILLIPVIENQGHQNIQIESTATDTEVVPISQETIEPIAPIAEAKIIPMPQEAPPISNNNEQGYKPILDDLKGVTIIDNRNRNNSISNNCTQNNPFNSNTIQVPSASSSSNNCMQTYSPYNTTSVVPNYNNYGYGYSDFQQSQFVQLPIPIYTQNNSIIESSSIPQKNSLSELEKALNEVKNRTPMDVLVVLNILMQLIEKSYEEQVKMPTDPIFRYIYNYAQKCDHTELMKIIRKFMLCNEVRDKILEMLNICKNVKVMKNNVYTNLSEFGYWESITSKNDMDKISIFKNIISINCYQSYGFYMYWPKGHTILEDLETLFSSIHDNIQINPSFLFYNEDNKDEVSLKELNMNNPYINFKTFIVNYKDLRVIKKNITEHNGVNIVESITYNNETHPFSELSKYPFDYYLNTDPEVIITEKGFELKNKNEINCKMINYIKDTMLDGDELKLKQIMQHIAYCISPRKNQKKVLFIIGEANSGKSKLGDLISSLFPKELVSILPIHKLSSNESQKELMQKKINIGNESNENMKNLSTFKTIVSGEEDTYKSKGVYTTGKYNIGLIFIANEFIKPINIKSTKDFPNGYLDKFTIVKTKSKKDKWAMSKDEFETEIVSESTKQAFITLALYELNSMYINRKHEVSNGVDTFSFDFIETEDEIMEKKNHVRLWLENEQNRNKKSDIVSLYSKEYGDYEYWPIPNIPYTNEYISKEILNSLDDDYIRDIYGIRSFLMNEVLYVSLDELEIDLEDIMNLNSFFDIKKKIGQLQKSNGYEVTKAALYECYKERMDDNVAICSEKDFTQKVKSILSEEADKYLFDIIRTKKKSAREKNEILEEYNNIIIDILKRSQYEKLYVIFFDENKIDGHTLTAFRGIKIRRIEE